MKTTMSAKEYIVSRRALLLKDKEVLDARIEELTLVLEGIERDETIKKHQVEAPF